MKSFEVNSIERGLGGMDPAKHETGLESVLSKREASAHAHHQSALIDLWGDRHVINSQA